MKCAARPREGKVSLNEIGKEVAIDGGYVDLANVSAAVAADTKCWTPLCGALPEEELLR